MTTQNKEKQEIRKEDLWRNLLDQHNLDLLDYYPGGTLQREQVKFRCLSCGDVDTVPTGKLKRRKYWCQGCNEKFYYTTENIKALIKTQGGAYLGGTVLDRESPIDLICPGCQEKTQKRAQDIVRRPETCNLCRGQAIRKSVLSKANHLKAAKDLALSRGGECSTQEGPVALTDKLDWKCGLGHTWASQLSSVRNQNSWCPTCDTSIAENSVRAVMEAAFNLPFQNCKPDFLQGLQLDGFNEQLGLAFEVQGVQHYQKHPKFHKSIEDLQSQRERDARKKQLCQEQGVTLLIVPHTVTDNGLAGIRPFLQKLLVRVGHKPLKDISNIEIDMRVVYDVTTDFRYQAFKVIVAKQGGSYDLATYQRFTLPISMTCEEGHTWKTTPALVVKGHWCPNCVGNARNEIETLKASLAVEGWSLREDLDYVNAHQTLPLSCPNGHPVNRSWNAWQQGQQSCQQCKKEKDARSFLEKMKDRGIKMRLSVAHYKNGHQIAKGVCLFCGHTATMKVVKWKFLSSCPGCNKNLEAFHPCMRKTPRAA